MYFINSKTESHYFVHFVNNKFKMKITDINPIAVAMTTDINPIAVAMMTDINPVAVAMHLNIFYTIFSDASSFLVWQVTWQIERKNTH